MTATGSRLEWQWELAKLGGATGYLPLEDDPGQSDNKLRRARHFARYLAEYQDALLVLDNMEEPDLLRSVLPDLAGMPFKCVVLYTSRQPKVPLGFSAHEVDWLTDEGALTVLLKGLHPKLLEETLAGSQSAEAQAARVLCHEVENLPLGLMHLHGLLAEDTDSPVVRLLQDVIRYGMLHLADKEYEDASPLFGVFHLSWQRVQDETARRPFLLEGYFPEAAALPLWLLGMATGLGEDNAPGTARQGASGAGKIQPGGKGGA